MRESIEELIERIFQEDIDKNYPLKSCPMCGRYVKMRLNTYDNTDIYSISCDCGVRIEEEYDPEIIYKKWNTRFEYNKDCD